MQQLKMLRPGGAIPSYPLPAGYRYTLYAGTEADIEDWLSVCRGAILPDDAERRDLDAALARYPDTVPVRDMILVEDPDGRRVATVTVSSSAGGEGHVHLIAARPACRGKGIGHAMLSHALGLLEARGCAIAALSTDDFRLAAIKVYLDMGFRPVICRDPESDMRARWDAVIARLGYEPVPYMTEV